GAVARGDPDGHPAPAAGPRRAGVAPGRRPMLGILCVDDNPMVGESIERWIEGSTDLRWDGWFPGEEGVLEAVRGPAPAVIWMDVDIPGTDTFALVREIVRASPETRVLMLSGHLRSDYVRRSVMAGAMGYMGKHRPIQMLDDALRRVAAGEFVLCDD